MVSSNPVRYADGVVQIGAADLSSDGFGVPWGQSRSWTNGPGYAAGGDNGNGWVDAQTPRLLQADGSTNTTIVAVSNGTTARYFDLVSGAYKPRFFDQTGLVHNAANDEFVLTDSSGDQLHFADFNTAVPPAEQGVLKSFVDPYGNVTAVTSWTPSGQPAEVQRGTVSGGNTITESYLYAYLPAGTNGGLLQSVTLRRQTNGGAWSTVAPGAVRLLRRRRVLRQLGRSADRPRCWMAPTTCWTRTTTATTRRPTQARPATSAV